eukprot:CAMPEP_0172388118 /NCGR_PEP_ID=MMETSP1061-20121228/5280_1 /TAXON_ID=37318 /ORGANISM="Pseudo-nitzschia pungens, Strain cf. pungens" /LENGTH=102 /DNA_ID=CAMNT_0013117933 /DNA_START=73 /DNA_END=381 /DNA_ORIENTATION=-
MVETTGLATSDGTSKREGYFLVGIGLLLIGSPVVSVVSWLLSVASEEEAKAMDGSDVVSFQNHALVRYWKENRAYWRVLTFLPAVLVICICHWVSLRIYLRR